MTRFFSNRFLRFAVLIFVGGIGFALQGCSGVNRAIDSAADAAGEVVGEAVGQRIASAADLPTAGTTQWNQFMVAQAQVLFNYAFSAGGMWPAEATYEEGEWTEYRVGLEGESGINTLERAFLTTTEDGNEWWRVRATQNDESWVYEALVDPDQREVVRLRSEDPEGNVGEIPVTEQTVYNPPQRLTDESVEGATTGSEEVETPAGTFTARRVEYAGGMAGGQVTWYLSDSVPGHVVKYRVTGSDSDAWESTLIDYGTDASSVLNSY